MCLVSVLPKGTTKYSDEVTDFIKQGFQSNRDGSGYMYKRKGESFIHVKKGFFSNVNLLLEDLEKQKLTEDDELVIHHRIGTSGKVSSENCHPFVVSKNHDEVIITDGIVEKPTLVHNGVFSDLYTYMRQNPDFSDTYAFTRFVVNYSLDMIKDDLPLFKKAFNDFIGYSKICMLFPDRDLIMIGNFIENNGYYHSNNAYKNWRHTDIGGRTVTNNSNVINLPAAVNNKQTTVLSGHVININEFNFNHFVYQKQNLEDYHTYIISKYDSDEEDVILEVDKGNFLQIKHITQAQLHSMYNFHPKPYYKNYYDEYLRALEKFTPSKNLFKEMYRYLTTKVNDNVATITKIKGVNVTRFTLINYYMSLAPSYLKEGSQYLVRIEQIYNAPIITIQSKKTETNNEIIELFEEIQNASCEC